MKRAWLSSPGGLQALPVQAILAQAHQDIIFNPGNASNQVVAWCAVRKTGTKTKLTRLPPKHKRKYILQTTLQK